MHKKFFSLFLSGLLLFSTAACGPGTQLERVTISAEDIVVSPSEEQTSVPEDSSALPKPQLPMIWRCAFPLSR